MLFFMSNLRVTITTPIDAMLVFLSSTLLSVFCAGVPSIAKAVDGLCSIMYWVKEVAVLFVDSNGRRHFFGAVLVVLSW